MELKSMSKRKINLFFAIITFFTLALTTALIPQVERLSTQLIKKQLQIL